MNCNPGTQHLYTVAVQYTFGVQDFHTRGVDSLAKFIAVESTLRGIKLLAPGHQFRSRAETWAWHSYSIPVGRYSLNTCCVRGPRAASKTDAAPALWNLTLVGETDDKRVSSSVRGAQKDGAELGEEGTGRAHFYSEWSGTAQLERSLPGGSQRMSHVAFWRQNVPGGESSPEARRLNTWGRSGRSADSAASCTRPSRCPLLPFPGQIHLQQLPVTGHGEASLAPFTPD